MTLTSLRRRIRTVRRRFREARLVALAFKDARHPVLAHVVPIRRCNLSCSYCNEFDKHSLPVPLEEMLRRIDRLADLGTTAIHLSGGEPLLHPDLDAIIVRIRERGMLAGLLTNGYLLTRERIRRLNRAGLDQLQISIDNVVPDEVSKKSLKVLDKKARLLADDALFDVNINSVLGSGIEHAGDALVVARRARELGFTGTVGIIHDGSGCARPLNELERRTWTEIRDLQPDRFWSFNRYEDEFQENLIAGRPNRWDCAAGGRYLYICEDGLVHWCSQQRGTPGIPLAEYTGDDLDRERRTTKSCAPFCTVSCVHRVSVLDRFRERPLETIVETLSPSQEEDSLADVPLPVRAMAWMFVRSSNAHRFKKAALRALRVDSRSSILPAIGGILALAACATLESLGIVPLRFDQADDRPSELRILSPSVGRPLGGAAIRLWADIENPNGFGLTLTEVAGDLLLESTEAIAVDFPLGLPLVAYQDTVIPLDVSIGFDDLPRLGQIAQAAIGGDALDYRLDGTFAVEAGSLGRPRFGPLTLLQGEIRVR